MKSDKRIKNGALLNLISPMHLGFERTSMQVGENRAKGYGVIKYAAENEYGWLSKVTNLPNSVVSITYEPLDTSEMINVIDGNINAAKKRGKDAQKTSEETRAEKEIKNSRKLLEEMDDKNESIGLVSTVIVPMSKPESFEKIERKAKSTAKQVGCNMRCLVNQQKEAYRQISPTRIPSEDLQEVLGQVMPLSTVIGGFPFSKSGFNDGTGYYFAKDDGGGIITMSPWIRANDRTNSNMAVLGGSGAGKSTKVKDMITDEYAMGTRFIVIDPEDEYKELCNNLKGTWLNAAGASNCHINPLQIQVIPKEEGEDSKEEGFEVGQLALYIKHLETFFKLYSTEIDDYLMAYLKQLLIEVYAIHNITFETDVTNLKPEDYPIMEELVALAQEKSRMYAGHKVADDYSKLALLLWDAAAGADAYMFNGYTTVQADNQFVCISTSGLNISSDRIKRTQYYNLLTWAWNMISQNRIKRIILICDEAYLLIDPEIPQSLIFLRNAMKRARKYEAAIWIISQNIEDFLSDSVKMYGKELLENPTYKILMSAEGDSLDALAKLYHLTQKEITILESKMRGQALFVIGSRRMHVKFEIPEYKFEYFGSSGGR